MKIFMIIGTSETSHLKHQFVFPERHVRWVPGDTGLLLLPEDNVVPWKEPRLCIQTACLQIFNLLFWPGMTTTQQAALLSFLHVQISRMAPQLQDMPTSPVAFWGTIFHMTELSSRNLPGAHKLPFAHNSYLLFCLHILHLKILLIYNIKGL